MAFQLPKAGIPSVGQRKKTKPKENGWSRVE
jgi:hypothetical protein